MVRTICNCNFCLLERDRLNAQKATTTNPGTAGNPPTIDPSDLERWLERRIVMDSEACDPDNYLDGLQFVLRVLRKRNEWHAAQPERASDPLPILDGIYSGAQGMSDALGAVALSMVGSPVPLRVIVKEA